LRDCAKALEAWDVAMKTPAATDRDLRKRMDDGRAKCKPAGSGNSGGTSRATSVVCSSISRDTWEEYRQGVKDFTDATVAFGNRQEDLLDRARRTFDRSRKRADGKVECRAENETYSPLYYLGAIALLSEGNLNDGRRRACEFWRQGNRDVWEPSWLARFRDYKCLPEEK
jgi:hypothetical protein